MTPPPPTRPAKQYALRFISGKYQGGEFPLPNNKEIVVGRSSELDMVLVEDMVSRRHAKLTVTGDQIFIQDLGSTNGTFVNGEKIKRARLQEGDRILIGTSIIKLVASDSAASGDAKAKLEDVAAGRRTSQVRTMSGSIAEIPLPDLMQLFSASKKSGVLVIRTDADVGKIFIDNGRVIFAVVNEHYDVAPLKSLFRILTWQTGSFDMDPPEAREFLEKIEMSTEGILMEAMRQIDEIRRLGTDMPTLQSSVLLAMPMIPPLRDLSPEELDVLQLAYNYGHVETVLNKSLASDLDTSQILVKLIKSGYLRVE
ncbi:FHA-domain-containing protein [Sandaracinus amylolyticus]|uniref:FHA-domain-containing protein n=1 Tax=Sandaracinus amylolyticus TaxID=927083 RepID=A0A0F6YHX7_9BACT|nr:FHA-domain-containing protein [Sandaracinus amylolyticus]